MSLSQAHRSPTIEEQDVADFDGIAAHFWGGLVMKDMLYLGIGENRAGFE